MAGLKRYATYLVLLTSYLFSSCGVQQQLSRSAKETVLQQPVFKAAHVGISIYEPATGKYWFNYQGDKYFVPASNTKIPTCYAAMKYLGDSLVGLRYKKTNDSILFQPTGDPTFLLSEFKKQPVFDYLKNTKGIKIVNLANWKEKRFGSGWSWNDYLEPYMAERSVMPVYGNLRMLTVNRENNFSKNFTWALPDGELTIIPKYSDRIFQTPPHLDFDYYDSAMLSNHVKTGNSFYYDVVREIGSNKLSYKMVMDQHSVQRLPLYTENFEEIKKFLEDTVGSRFEIDYYDNMAIYNSPVSRDALDSKIHSQPTDSLLKPMMHRSDNFFAEQSLLMVSNELLGVMNDEKIIDTLLKTDFKDLPQKPRWADGSGLSRYNLFTPQDMVAILNKMKNEFGMERIKVIFPTGGEGTISSYYKQDAGFIYGKTGTLSGVVAFSGFLYTKKGKLLIFSTLINNHQGSATDIRRAIENFLQGVRSKY
jgi:D-alanyl-D-alanine carboxypeptidase/D-alanyl-D-alanine-endopeptidase (penicillin-binding protein 4)